MKLSRKRAFISFLALAVMLLGAGCASTKPKLIDAQDVPLYGSDPLYHTVYKGSDEQFHHFRWNQGIRGGQLKVKKEALNLSREFALGEGKAFLKKTPDGSFDMITIGRQESQ